jgi:hypothetical protein
MSTTRVQETEREAIARLLAKAKVEGVTIVRDHTDGRFYASSVSKPGAMHYVTAYSCTCIGFSRHQRCKHLVALWSHLGYFGPEPDPEPTPACCPAVAVVHVPGAWGPGGYLVCTRDIEWTEPVTTITIDGDSAVRVVGDQFDVRVHWLEDGRSADSMTTSMPTGLTHRAAVEYWLRSLAASAPVDRLLFNAGIPEDRDAWDDLPDADVADDADNSLEEVA